MLREIVATDNCMITFKDVVMVNGELIEVPDSGLFFTQIAASHAKVLKNSGIPTTYLSADSKEPKSYCAIFADMIPLDIVVSDIFSESTLLLNVDPKVRFFKTNQGRAQISEHELSMICLRRDDYDLHFSEMKKEDFERLGRFAEAKQLAILAARALATSWAEQGLRLDCVRIKIGIRTDKTLMIADSISYNDCRWSYEDISHAAKYGNLLNEIDSTSEVPKGEDWYGSIRAIAKNSRHLT